MFLKFSELKRQNKKTHVQEKDNVLIPAVLQDNVSVKKKAEVVLPLDNNENFKPFPFEHSTGLSHWQDNQRGKFIQLNLFLPYINLKQARIQMSIMIF